MSFANGAVAVVIPVYNESRHIKQVLASIPNFVDHIIVVDDASTDGSLDIIKHYEQSRLIIIAHETNQGVGAAIASGYMAALKTDARAIAVMGGDGQMDPDELASIVTPVLEQNADYAKGNRFMQGMAFHNMPLSRYIGNVMLSFASRPLTGYWQLFDSQCGYTCISRTMLKQLNINELYPRYGVPNDILSRLGLLNATITERPVTPIYRDHRSHMNLLTLPFTLGSLMISLGMRRLLHKTNATRSSSNEATHAAR